MRVDITTFSYGDRFTTYDRDANQSDEAMHRRYNRFHPRFDQPDPWQGSARAVTNQGAQVIVRLRHVNFARRGFRKDDGPSATGAGRDGPFNQ